MNTFRGLWIGAALLWASLLGAQEADDLFFVQIEAHPTRTAADRAVATYGATLEDVNGFMQGPTWHAIALGPYAAQSVAEEVLIRLRNAGTIPPDSFIAFPGSFDEQFYPRGADVIRDAAAGPPIEEPAPQTPSASLMPLPAEPAPQTGVAAPPSEAQALEETPQEARENEQRLSEAQRREIQVALQWAGYYRSTIDGAFGRGTRAAMAAWQRDNGVETTGILTTNQRARLLEQYNAVFDGLDLASVLDPQAGIQMAIPLGVMQFEAYDYPFAKYAPTGDLPAQILMISQTGDRDTLFGLYEIMQTLEIVPLNGDRQRRDTSFVLTGRNAEIVSHTEAALQDGEIKGFTLVWPTGDEERRQRLLDRIRSSFTRLSGTLDPSLVQEAAQAIDLVAGLQVRSPTLARSGFFVSETGSVLTARAGIAACSRLTIDEETEAQVVAENAALGLALLRPERTLAPRTIARFGDAVPRLQSAIAVAGYSYEGVLGAPSTTFGVLSDLRGLEGEAELARLSVETLDGDVGGPVLDEAGAVIGVLLPRDDGTRRLPDDVRFAVNRAAVGEFLTAAGIETDVQGTRAPMAPEDIARRARDMTVLVSCWD